MVEKDRSGDNAARPDQPGWGARWHPLPELPDDVAIAGRKTGRQYLYRPGEILARTRDLERDSGTLRRRLEDEFGAVVAVAPPSRLPCRNTALDRLERDPGGAAVKAATARLVPKGRGGGAVLRQRVLDGAVRRKRRDEHRRGAAAETLERQGATLLLLPPEAPPVPAVLKELRRRRDPAVTHVWANQVFSPEQDLGWVPAIPAVRLPGGTLAPSPGAGSAGRGVRVAIVDTGIRTRHAWLAGAQARDVDYEELDEDGDLVLDFKAGHGTFVAGVVLQQAPGATIIGRAAVDTAGFTDDLALAAALDSLQDQCVDILNLSVGGPADPVEPAPATRAAIDRLRRGNPRLAVVGAAGNRNRPDLFYPAAFPDVIAVGALDHDLRRAPFSNYGPWVNAWALGIDVESAYVGEDVTASFDTDPAGSTDGARWSGTSFAAPRVAGAIAAAMRPGP